MFSASAMLGQVIVSSSALPATRSCSTDLPCPACIAKDVHIKLRIDGFKTNLADDGLHSLNMGEVRHVCRLEMERNIKRALKENEQI